MKYQYYSYKENFSPSYAGAVSIFINDTLKLVSTKNTIVMVTLVLKRNIRRSM